MSAPVVIVPYLGYGTARGARLHGRVLEDEGIRPLAAGERRWRNLVAFLKRMETDPVRGARVLARRGHVAVESLSDRQGYFTAALAARLRPGWNDVVLELPDRPGVRASGRVLVPLPQARFGVISDIDDTVVYSNAMRKMRMVVSLALSNAHTRKPFKGVGAFYRALHGGANPVFYVSKSPWNLFVPLVEYLQHQGLPLGPLLLRDYGLRMPKHHKQQAIDAILGTYPRLPFVLIGDSGEEDPEIYSAVVRRHPQRIKAIYIRSVNPDRRRIAAIDALIGETAKTGSQLVLAPDSEYAAAHAAAEGLIPTGALDAVRQDKKTDLKTPKQDYATRARRV